MRGFSPKMAVSFYRRSKDVAVFARKGSILLPEVEGCGGFCQKGQYPSTGGRRMWGCEKKEGAEGAKGFEGTGGVAKFGGNLYFCML